MPTTVMVTTEPDLMRLRCLSTPRGIVICGAFVLVPLEALTPSERRVAALAAEGQSNREIAQSLFLTVKTVETHLSSAYRKLDIRSRRDLAHAL